MQSDVAPRPKPCNEQRSLWSAVAWYRFGSHFVDPGLSWELTIWFTCRHCGLVNCSVISEVASRPLDYQSGTKLPHSKGCRPIVFVAVISQRHINVLLNSRRRYAAEKGA